MKHVFQKSALTRLIGVGLLSVGLMGITSTANAASITTQVGCSLGPSPGFGADDSINCGEEYLKKAFGVYKYGDSHAHVSADYGELHAFADAQSNYQSSGAGFKVDTHDVLVFQHPTAKTVDVTVKLWIEGNTFASDGSIPDGEVFPHAFASAYAQFNAGSVYGFRRVSGNPNVSIYSSDTPLNLGAPNALETYTFSVPVGLDVSWNLYLEGGASARSYERFPNSANTLYKSSVDIQNTVWLQIILNDPLITYTSESGSLYAGPSPVPEPETYGMMVAGLGLLVWRRRK